ncbi:MAG: hypothetical protein ISR67_01225 [Sulfurimonas sp.]|nr:hypothetical protein [Sulfurimonas sp.]
MDIGVYSIDKINNNDIKEKISNRESFILKDIENSFWGETLQTVEDIIESKDLKVRVFTKGRKASMAAMAATPIPSVFLSGLASSLAIGVHNLATWNPDYEIAKNQITGTLTITYKK